MVGEYTYGIKLFMKLTLTFQTELNISRRDRALNDAGLLTEWTKPFDRNICSSQVVDPEVFLSASKLYDIAVNGYDVKALTREEYR